jgi:hypothetical protein
MWAKTNLLKTFLLSNLICILALFIISPVVNGLTRIPVPSPAIDSYGLEATKTQLPPTQGATISIPANGASFSNSPITVGGICPTGLLVEIYDNGVMVGAENCTSGSFSLSVSLFNGTNDLTASVYDSYDQAGPVSNTVSVTFNNTNITAFGDLVTLTSNYGRRAAAPGASLTWPLLLSGGTGPYAFSINWGDNSDNQLKSVPLPGVVNIDHIYKSAGIYNITIQATDVNNTSAFLQVVAVINGTATITTASSSSPTKHVSTSTQLLWLPALIAIVLMIPVYILGRRSQLVALRKRLERERKAYAEKKQ